MKNAYTYYFFQFVLLYLFHSFSGVEDVFVPPSSNNIPQFGFMPKVQSTPQLKFRFGSSSSVSDEFDEEEDNRVDKVYTVGCFDLFHRGHIVLLKNMRKLGKEV